MEFKKETEASLSGKLFYSRKQFAKARNEGKDRTFAKTVDGDVVEYTELISFEQLAESPFDTCLEADGQYIGMGSFDHFRDEQGRRY
jgi:hypothetical protein